MWKSVRMAGIVTFVALGLVGPIWIWARGAGAQHEFANAVITQDYGVADLLLLLNPGLVNARTRHCFQSHSPLFWAAWEDAPRQAEFLLTHGAATESRDLDSRQTPMHAAAWNGCTGVVRLLIEHGADVNSRDARGKTPMALARESGHTETFQVLAQHGARE